ncbi:hypothetical protein FA15DRAFT_684190 [Coprinopsis marcescibilis]|uniref:Fe2OG dioxygenase domain-containing protein n=1 Tax=Coprinopsis marcescibilis TaxID=230819 RepID=A0A5C3LBS7_COPMA|nr:hypothetical protein FA15DRAFT_684190 [Coprinopsis marcescibilis]
MSSVSDLLDPSSPAYKKARRQFYKATKNRPDTINNDWTPFRAAEKRYKARFPPPDLASLLDLAQYDSQRSNEIADGVWRGSLDSVSHTRLNSKVDAYAIPDIPGLVILPSFLSHSEQHDLVRWSLERQACYPNPTNLDVHYHLPREGLWTRSLQDPDSLILPKSLDSDTIDTPSYGPRQLVNNAPISVDNYKKLADEPKPPPAPSATVSAASAVTLIPKLRWANIGWYYHWGTKQYDFSQGKGEIDKQLRTICKRAVLSVDWKDVYGGLELDWEQPDDPEWKHWPDMYDPDAGIVNFYQTKDTLMAHVDRSEVCATSPLVSISLGSAAVFLIGGKTRDSEPIPVLLRSGDAVIMSGPVARRAYHGVPRVLESSLPSHLSNREDDPEWEPFAAYLRTTRININVRQHTLDDTMENDAGVLVDLYVPRKCSATNRLITSKDHASVQIVIADVDANGRALSTNTTFAFSGQVRSQGEGDDSLNRLATKAGLLRNVWSYQK